MPDSSTPERLGNSRLKLHGSDNALYERHLAFDQVSLV